MKNPPYQSVSIQPGLQSCKAAWLLVGERYLLNQAPKLPLPECNFPRCDCRFNQHDDRREPGERREMEDERPNKGRRSDD